MINKNLFLVFTICTILIQHLEAQGTITLKPDYDAAIGYHDNFNTGDENYGDAIQNAGYKLPGNYGGFNVNRALIHFDLSCIPDGVLIVAAKLDLFAFGQVQGYPGHTGENNNGLLQRVIEDWAEYSVTWNNQPDATDQNQVELPASSDPLEDYRDIDVTALVADMRNEQNFGFLLRLYNEISSNMLIFCSLDHPDTLKCPSLELTYFTVVQINESANLFHIYPNPVNNSFEVRVNDYSHFEEVNVELFNMVGQTIASKIASEENISFELNNEAPGIYFVRVCADDNSQTRKIILLSNN